MIKYRVEIAAWVCVSVDAENQTDLLRRVAILLQDRFEEGEDLAPSKNFRDPRIYFTAEPQVEIVDFDTPEEEASDEQS